jgi:hypothetical protein
MLDVAGCFRFRVDDSPIVRFGDQVRYGVWEASQPHSQSRLPVLRAQRQVKARRVHACVGVVRPAVGHATIVTNRTDNSNAPSMTGPDSPTVKPPFP